jgi:hypothetical protein
MLVGISSSSFSIQSTTTRSQEKEKEKEEEEGGGEDASELQAFPILEQILLKWNSSLPPFDMSFYHAICCEEMFVKDYTILQEKSIQIVNSNNNTQSNIFIQQWQEALLKWRQNILLAFGTLISPSLWKSLSEQFQRTIPQELLQIEQQILQIWKIHPNIQNIKDRRLRLEKIHHLMHDSL